MPDSDLSASDQLDAIGALAEPNRRSLYDYVVASGDWVGRDQAADGTGLQRGIAAHHLDRLTADGLLEVDYQRLSGRSGPGAGRPAKLYRRSRREFDLALPPRHYELAAQLLADAVATSSQTGIDIREALNDTARSRGNELGQTMRRALGRGRSKAKTRSVVLETLSDFGYEPDEIEDGTIVLRNCPFHRLAQTHTDLICGMNHCLVEAALAELGNATLAAQLEPDSETCCVRIHQR